MVSKTLPLPPVQSHITEESTFAEAWPVWWQNKQQNISPKTAKCYREYYRALEPFFACVKLCDFSIERIAAYRSYRVTAGPGLVNHEVNCLSQLLASVGLWASIAKVYKPLRIPKSGPGIALLPEEEQHLFDLAMNGPKKWTVVYCASLITNHTTAGPGEIRHLQLKHIDLRNRILHVQEGVKNDFRVRDIPLNDEAFWAVSQLVARATRLGATVPDHYLLPGRAPRKGEGWMFSKPMLSWKKAWHALRKEAAKKYPRLAKLRMYDLRHHAFTKLLENPAVSEEVVEDIAGHALSSKMKKRYSHIRMKAKKDAVQALCNDGIARTPIGSHVSTMPVQWSLSTLTGYARVVETGGGEHETKITATPDREANLA